MGRPTKPLPQKLTDQLRAYPGIPVSMILVNHQPRREIHALLRRLIREGVLLEIHVQHGRRMVATYRLAEVEPATECTA